MFSLMFKDHYLSLTLTLTNTHTHTRSAASAKKTKTGVVFYWSFFFLLLQTFPQSSVNVFVVIQIKNCGWMNKHNNTRGLLF